MDLMQQLGNVGWLLGPLFIFLILRMRKQFNVAIIARPIDWKVETSSTMFKATLPSRCCFLCAAPKPYSKQLRS